MATKHPKGRKLDDMEPKADPTGGMTVNVGADLPFAADRKIGWTKGGSHAEIKKPGAPDFSGIDVDPVKNRK